MPIIKKNKIISKKYSNSNYSPKLIKTTVKYNLAHPPSHPSTSHLPIILTTKHTHSPQEPIPKTKSSASTQKQSPTNNPSLDPLSAPNPPFPQQPPTNLPPFNNPKTPLPPQKTQKDSPNSDNFPTHKNNNKCK